MSNTGSTLQLKKTSSILCNAQLLVVTDNTVNLHKIEQILQTIPLSFTYHSVSCSSSVQALSERQYDLILYNYSHSKNCSSHKNNEPHPIKELSWWYDLPSKIPLILITEPLGDEIAVDCIQSGISDYILIDKLYKLRHSLEKKIINFTSKNTVNLQKLLNEISHLKKELKRLQQKNSDLKITSNNINQEYFSHLNHELRSPLANILQFARMLKEEIYGSLNKKQTEYICGILTSGNHLSELINDYLDIAKIDANHEELYKEKVTVEDICKASLVMVQGRAKKKDINLILDIARDIDFCFVDSLRLKQILINLLSNAIKFTEKGYVKLQVRLTSTELLFSVVDTGIGISKENFDKLFKPFQQIKTSIHRKYKGTGLGLALSLKLAQLHGGNITIVSEEGKGSCFTVSIPHNPTDYNCILSVHK